MLPSTYARWPALAAFGCCQEREGLLGEGKHVLQCAQSVSLGVWMCIHIVMPFSFTVISHVHILVIQRLWCIRQRQKRLQLIAAAGVFWPSAHMRWGNLTRKPHSKAHTAHKISYLQQEYGNWKSKIILPPVLRLVPLISPALSNFCKRQIGIVVLFAFGFAVSNTAFSAPGGSLQLAVFFSETCAKILLISSNAVGSTPNVTVARHQTRSAIKKWGENVRFWASS